MCKVTKAVDVDDLKTLAYLATQVQAPMIVFTMDPIERDKRAIAACIELGQEMEQLLKQLLKGAEVA